MADNPPEPEVDRREFLNGRWPTRAEGRAGTNAEIASVLVQARPERLDEVAGAIAALPGVEIHSRSPQGKLVVVIEAADVGAIGTTLNTISSLPHVAQATHGNLCLPDRDGRADAPRARGGDRETSRAEGERFA